MGFFARGSIVFHYEIAGEGPPFVLSHAISRDTTQTERYISQPEGYCVIRWDARAHGRTAPIGPVEQLNFSDFAEDLAALLDHLGIEDAFLGGISMGAATTAAFCRRWPSRVRAAVLVRPAWLNKPHPTSLNSVELIGHLLMRHAVEEARRRFLQSREYELLQNASSRAAEQALALFDEPGSVERAARLVHIPASTPISDWQDLCRCTMPILVVGNENDPFHPLEVARQWAEHLPNAELSLIASAIEYPQQHTSQLRQAILSFLQTLSTKVKCRPTRLPSCVAF